MFVKFRSVTVYILDYQKTRYYYSSDNKHTTRPLIREYSTRIKHLKVYSDKHCYFTFSLLSGAIKTVLGKRGRKPKRLLAAVPS